MAYGMLGQVGVSFQTSFGTSSVASLFWHRVINETLTQNKPPLTPEGMNGVIDERNAHEGPNDVVGDIVTEVHPILIGQLLQAWTNAVSDSTLVTSVYQTTMKPPQTDFDQYAAVNPATIEVYRDAGSAFKYYDMLCNAFSIEIANGVLHKVTTSWIGGKFAKSAKETPSYIPASDYEWSQTCITFTNSAGNAVAANGVMNLTISGNNNLENKHTLNGTKDPSHTKRAGKRTMELAGTILFENQDEYDKFNDFKAQRIVVRTEGQDASSGYPTVLQFDNPRTIYNDHPVNIGGPGMVEVSISSRIEYHADSGTITDITLQNTHSAYA
jgi:hypothetical protein